ncbi:PadR family transcriptional regulator [Kosmotoga olearia]|uniref:Transcriptional regulator, PadR-like family n=1 Tax=Kosmotoga olearia (strain ATCC BAA-1733 / DSM 21960 / TBF 19.5.1) TaxID=521045 RepID=C5CI45_KOSOT|nr:helix-turn-helix transcriptional regulator [Kosmotoga olearia]ACR79824.1 transcriptional regulator, PadR-like family [Kosmotoga olearia TBF 19.5.1]
MPGFGRGFGRGRGMWRWWQSAFLLLLIAEKPGHGYELSERLRELGLAKQGISNMGNLYRLLAELEMNGFVIADWDTSAPGPAKKIYRITDSGMMFLDEAASHILEFEKVLSEFKEKYNRLRNRKGEE